ncbi:hypothetical protein [Mesorhizobium huakuii]|uniref:Uncharacterized protein n=1 Tax=Mesorhizobium huakuii TaxID=28104 RepID=A0A7G6T0T6_9HYPH|nr:hypothetical protein [Mesorhizobium huakuii]QND60368.1 hypothetical protein HB778_30345 [Mesorhizobium huakuii]
MSVRDLLRRIFSFGDTDADADLAWRRRQYAQQYLLAAAAGGRKYDEELAIEAHTAAEWTHPGYPRLNK